MSNTSVVKENGAGALLSERALGSRYVLIPLFCQLTGYSEKAVRRKLEERVWREGKQYRRAPDGRIIMDLLAYEKWVVGQ